MQIDGDFPGGNVIVRGIDGDTARISQDVRDTEGFWFYWSFRVRGAAGRTATFAFEAERSLLGTRGPCVSTDGGATWSWLGAQSVKDNSFTYSFADGANEVYFAVGLPYLETNLRAFLARHKGNAALKQSVLCRSEAGRDVELLHAGRLDGEEQYRMLFTCRHHCCEAMASYVLEGILEAALAPDELGAWYRGRVLVEAVPFVDKDGVEVGDQGKNRKPYDHNRDYAEDPGNRYTSVRAIKARVNSYQKRGLDFTLDLHCPYLKGGETNEQLYFVGSPHLDHWERVGRLSAILEKTRRGPLPYEARYNLPYGKSWNNYEGPLMTCGRFNASRPWVGTATSIEVPYANCGEVTTSPENVRAFGRDLAAALREFLTTEK